MTLRTGKEERINSVWKGDEYELSGYFQEIWNEIYGDEGTEGAAASGDGKVHAAGWIRQEHHLQHLFWHTGLSADQTFAGKAGIQRETPGEKLRAGETGWHGVCGIEEKI